MLSKGLEKTLVDTGSDKNAIAVRKAAATEIVSIVERPMADVVKADGGVARNTDGSPRYTGEVLVLINLLKRSNNEPSNVPVRGVDAMSKSLRPQFKITEGRVWNPGTSEIIAGKKVARNFKGCGIGETVRFGGREWTIVGIFESGNNGFESEVWGDINQLMDAFQRPVFSSLTFELAPGVTIDSVKKRMENDARLSIDVYPEKEYYRKQSSAFTTFINVLGIMISIVFSMGAVVGAMITMYASVANRTREIGTLRALGFSRGSVLGAFLVESLTISLAGGLIGILAANSLQLVEVSTTNFDTFAEIAFSFVMTPSIALSALTFALVMGIVGGFLPAVSASRLKILAALRAR
jgi:ABC-type antimicrobial peptide transport system permease subunit